MNKEKKIKDVRKLNNIFKDMIFFIFVNIHKLTTNHINLLRQSLYPTVMQTSKNSLVEIAWGKFSSTPIQLSGPTAIIWNKNDSLQALNALRKFHINVKPLTVYFGIYNHKVISSSDIRSLSHIRNKTEVYIKLIHLIQHKINFVVYHIMYPFHTLINILKIAILKGLIRNE